ncbi:MAG: lysophospholipid acyltransferase family protein [Gemmatimonadetes bacterium]|nr:lysophospholipid acyltransferase family protein [Gemmatimonadota bacterium]
MRPGLRYALAGRSGQLLLDALLGTARFEVQGAQHYREQLRAGRPVIFVLWHGRLVPLTYLHRHQGIATLISRSEDGEYIARVVEHWGYLTVRGSSTRGGDAALRQIVRHGRAGRSLAFTPDGPRGPRQKLKSGVLVAAQLTGMPIIPLAAATSRGWWFEGWDRFLIPKPFARIHVAYGAPRVVARGARPHELQRSALELEAELNRLMEMVDARAAHG